VKVMPGLYWRRGLRLVVDDIYTQFVVLKFRVCLLNLTLEVKLFPVINGIVPVM
jgi:hypothetical protein